MKNQGLINVEESPMQESNNCSSCNVSYAYYVLEDEFEYENLLQRSNLDSATESAKCKGKMTIEKTTFPVILKLWKIIRGRLRWEGGRENYSDRAEGEVVCAISSQARGLNVGRWNLRRGVGGRLGKHKLQRFKIRTIDFEEVIAKPPK